MLFKERRDWKWQACFMIFQETGVNWFHSTTGHHLNKQREKCFWADPCQVLKNNLGRDDSRGFIVVQVKDSPPVRCDQIARNDNLYWVQPRLENITEMAWKWAVFSGHCIFRDTEGANETSIRIRILMACHTVGQKRLQMLSCSHRIHQKRFLTNH